MANGSRGRSAVEARHRMREIERELLAIFRAFPDLARPGEVGWRRSRLVEQGDRGARIVKNGASK